MRHRGRFVILLAVLALVVGGAAAVMPAYGQGATSPAQLQPAVSDNDTGTFTYSNEGDEPADIWVGNGDKLTMLPQGTFENEEVEYYRGESSTVTFKFSTLFITKITELKINGTDYTSQVPDTPQEKVAAFNEQHTEFTVTVGHDTTYTIQTKTEIDREPGVGNFLWSYQDKDRGTDDFIDNGRIEFVRATYGDEVITSDNLKKGSARAWNEDAGVEGGAVFPAGSQLTVRLIPNHGSQLTSFGVNGGKFETGSDQCTYTFEVKPGNFHLAARFTHVNDVIMASAPAVTGGTVKLSDADVPVGSAVLNVASAQVDDAEKSALAQAASARGAYQVSDVFDMSLDQVVYKGTNSPEGAWTASLGSASPLKDPAQVSLQLGGVYASDVIVMHEEHDGSVTVVDSNYDAAANAVSFDAPGFSDYAIAIVPQKAAEVYRLYNPNSGEHFYTTNKGEYDAVQAAGWTGEGAAWHALAEGNRPVYRLYNPYGGEHHYTMSAHERDTLVQLGWTDEKVAFYAGDDTGTPVRRLYNPNKFSCNHLFTTDENEYKTVKGYGWNDEGIAWFAVPTGA